MYSFAHTLRRRYIALCLVLGASCVLLSCTQDNVHMPEGGTGAETWETYTASYTGLLSTTVPLMQEHLQGAVLSEMTVQMGEFHSAHSGYVTLKTQAFSIDDPFVVSMLGKAIEIGAMEIQDVEYAAFPTGGGYLKKEAFDIQAGEYRTRGALHGELTPSGRLTFTIRYRPGTMPFEIVSEFDTDNN